MKILCGTDLLPKSDSAIERAGFLAERLGAHLLLVHALSGAEPHWGLEEEMQRAGRQLRLRAMPPRWHYRVAPAIEVRVGTPTQVLVESARDRKASLIVLGSNRRRFVSDAFAGTIAERILKHVDCPVLLVRRMPWRAYRRVLFVIDCAQSKEVVAAAGRLVLDSAVSATIAQAHQSYCTQAAPTSQDYAVSGVERPVVIEKTMGSASALAAGTPQLAMVRKEAMMTDATRHQSRRLSPDLFVVGAEPRGWIRRMMKPDAVRPVLAMRGADVLIVPPRMKYRARPPEAGLAAKRRCSTRRRSPHQGELACKALTRNVTDPTTEPREVCE